MKCRLCDSLFVPAPPVNCAHGLYHQIQNESMLRDLSDKFNPDYARLKYVRGLEGSNKGSWNSWKVFEYSERCSRYWNMMASSNGNIFRVSGPLCGEFTGPRWIPRTKASEAELWCFLGLRLNKRLSKQSWCWWFETLPRPLWRQRNEVRKFWNCHNCNDWSQTRNDQIWTIAPLGNIELEHHLM